MRLYGWMITVILVLFVVRQATEPDIAGASSSSVSIWKKVIAVDEFGEPTKNKIVFGTVDGTFSNSATTNSRLKATVRFESDKTAGIVYTNITVIK